MQNQDTPNKPHFLRGIRQRSPGSWEVTVGTGKRDPVTGRYERIVKTVRGTLQDAVLTRQKLLKKAMAGSQLPSVRGQDGKREHMNVDVIQRHHYGKSQRAMYGLTQTEIDDMVRDQQGRCAICRRVPRRLVIDHDHETGIPRGLLCNSCNAGLGMFGDDVMKLRLAITYLFVHAQPHMT